MALLRYAHPEGLQLSEIGELLITSRANITGLVDHLEEKGYVSRTVDARDRRARVATLTERGEQLIDEVMPVHRNRVIEVFSALSAEEMQQLTVLLKKLRHNPAVGQADEEETAVFDPVFVSED
jgi:MarR family 2-MHQ and catechol resistance regulon transcriptional repressor